MNMNRRTSMAPRPGLTQQQYHQLRQQEEEPVIEMTDEEISSCLSEIGQRVSVNELRKPNPQQVQKLYEYLAELLMNTNRAIVSPALRAAAEDICGERADSMFNADIRDVMGLFVLLRHLFSKCQINDFSLEDLYHPRHKRLSKIIASIINFIRFREQHMSVYSDHLKGSDQLKQKIQNFETENAELEKKILKLRRQKKEQEESAVVKENQIQELKEAIIQLKDKQTVVCDEKEDLRERRYQIESQLKEIVTNYVQCQQESMKLKPFTLKSPEELERALQNLSERVSNGKTALERLEKRAQALSVSAHTFASLSKGVQKLTQTLSELATELTKEEEEQAKGIRYRDALLTETQTVKGLEQEERILHRNLESYLKNTDRLRAQNAERSKADANRLAELGELYKEFDKQRQQQSTELERKRIRVSQLESKMADIQEKLNAEIAEARSEYQNLESHIQLYITEMEQTMGESDVSASGQASSSARRATIGLRGLAGRLGR